MAKRYEVNTREDIQEAMNGEFPTIVIRARRSPDKRVSYSDLDKIRASELADYNIEIYHGTLFVIPNDIGTIPPERIYYSWGARKKNQNSVLGYSIWNHEPKSGLQSALDYLIEVNRELIISDKREMHPEIADPID